MNQPTDGESTNLVHRVEKELRTIEHDVESAAETVWRKITYVNPCPTPGCTQDRVACPNPKCLDLTEQGDVCPTCHGAHAICPVCDKAAWDEYEDVIARATDRATRVASAEDNFGTMI